MHQLEVLHACLLNAPPKVQAPALQQLVPVGRHILQHNLAVTRRTRGTGGAERILLLLGLLPGSIRLPLGAQLPLGGHPDMAPLRAAVARCPGGGWLGVAGMRQRLAAHHRELHVELARPPEPEKVAPVLHVAHQLIPLAALGTEVAIDCPRPARLRPVDLQRVSGAEQVGLQGGDGVPLLVGSVVLHAHAHVEAVLPRL
mmetsp:Transcript_22909/g.58753  ORF Transcript_22909/g.58753 Transcript_22909/m.58753 type:complete len:200 (+) Transcript_22909:447-1046(+)